MKLLKYTVIATLALSGALCACSDDNDYAPGAPVSGDEVYLPLTSSTSIDIPTDATEIPVVVSRVLDGDAITVDIASKVVNADDEDCSDIFTVPSSVQFAAGQKETTINVGVDFSKVVANEEYTLTIELEGNNTTPYGASSRTYTLVYAPWTEWEYIPGEIGEYTITQFASGTYDVDVVTRTSIIDENCVEYGVAGLFTNGIDFVYSMDKSKTIEVDGVDCPLVSMNVFNTGVENGSTGIFLVMTDVRTWLVDVYGVAEENVDAVMANNGWGQSYFNPVTGTFNMDIVLTGHSIAAEGRYYSIGYEYLQLPGYKSYVLDFNYTGNFVDPVNETEYAVVSAYKSNDVTSYVYDIFPGELTDEEINDAVAAMKEATDLTSVTENATNLTFVLDEAGKYTIIGLGKDGGEYVCTQSYTFSYKSVQGAPVEKWNSLGFVEYTDGYVCSIFNVPVLTNDVEIQESDEYPGVYRLVDPYKEWCETLGFDYNNGKYYMIVDASVPEEVMVYTFDLGFAVTSQYGESYGSSLAYILASDNRNPAGYWGTLEDGLITFPAGSLLFAMANYSNAAWLYANIDPENPTGGDEEDAEPFDPKWGEGTFSIDMASVLDAPAARAARPAVNRTSAAHYNGEMKQAFKTSFKCAALNSHKKTVSAKDLKDYRLANPVQFIK